MAASTLNEKEALLSAGVWRRGAETVLHQVVFLYNAYFISTWCLETSCISHRYCATLQCYTQLRELADTWLVWTSNNFQRRNCESLKTLQSDRKSEILELNNEINVSLPVMSHRTWMTVQKHLLNAYCPVPPRGSMGECWLVHQQAWSDSSGLWIMMRGNLYYRKTAPQTLLKSFSSLSSTDYLHFTHLYINASAIRTWHLLQRY